MSSGRKISGFFNPRSIRFRLTAFFIGFLGFTLIVFSTVLYRAIVRDQRTEFDAALYNYTTDISRSVDVTFFGNLTVPREVLWDREKIFPFRVGESFIQIIDQRGRVLARSQSLGKEKIPIFSDDLRVSKFQTSFRTIGANEIFVTRKKKGKFRLVTYPLDLPRAENLILQVAVPQMLLDQQIKNLFTFFMIAVPFTLIIVAFGGLYLSGRVLAPVSDIIEKASRIEASNLSERLPVPPVHDELRDLSLTLNSLLNRLEQAFESQERFVADASHQLKTPLAILKGELDVLKSRPRTQQEITEFMESSSQELKHLTGMVDNLLALARVDADLQSLTFESLRIDEIAVEVISRLEWLAREKEIKVRVDLLGSEVHHPTDFEIQGDADLIRTMIQNLAENAIKFSENGRVVELSLEGNQGELSVRVRNFGPVISEDQLKTIFERFQRATGSSIPGLGLGLAIVKRIAKAHGGEVFAESSPSAGTLFHIRLKK